MLPRKTVSVLRKFWLRSSRWKEDGVLLGRPRSANCEGGEDDFAGGAEGRKLGCGRRD